MHMGCRVKLQNGRKAHSEESLNEQCEQAKTKETKHALI